MNRRRFLQLFGLAATAQLIPGNRVWSFPSKIVIPQTSHANILRINLIAGEHWYAVDYGFDAPSVIYWSQAPGDPLKFPTAD